MDDHSGKDWSRIQSFLAVAETGSLSGAARALGVSQPTVGRHIEGLERALGTELFERHARGFHLSPTGRRMVPMAERMREAMNLIELTAAGEAQSVAGTVRVTASVFASHYILPPILSKLRANEPAIQIELVASDETESLLFRDADIAVRMYEPTQHDLVARHIGDTNIGVFAATAYLDRRGRPKVASELFDHDLVGYDRTPLVLDTMAKMGHRVDREAFATRCDNQAANWALVCAGCGIGFAQLAVGRSNSLVEELDLGLVIPSLPVWLVAHPSMRQTPRLKQVWAALADGLKDVII